VKGWTKIEKNHNHKGFRIAGIHGETGVYLRVRIPNRVESNRGIREAESVNLQRRRNIGQNTVTRTRLVGPGMFGMTTTLVRIYSMIGRGGIRADHQGHQGRDLGPPQAGSALDHLLLPRCIFTQSRRSLARRILWTQKGGSASLRTTSDYPRHLERIIGIYSIPM
jgi:hypothetical protein